VSTRRKRFLVAGLAEEALAGPEHNREDLQPQFVDEVVLHQRVYELEACGDDDFPIELVLQLRDLVEHVALEHVELFQSGSSRCAAARRPGGLIRLGCDDDGLDGPRRTAVVHSFDVVAVRV
jgi:hypothetical protein